ncbi:MAG TPA: CPBP family intramembrane glutamic endopeptidase [Polyangiaceae bacterium]|nr:CPBP family intramembrane glutamic endopeptidase [Polyangiaceae bacterium]
MLAALVAAVLAALATAVAMRPGVSGTAMVFAAPAVPYAILSVLAVLKMRRDGTLADKLRPRGGDLTFGALVTVMLFLGAVAFCRFLAAHGSVREGWIMRIYLQVGDPDTLQRRVIVLSLAVALVAALEEIAWRGFVFQTLEDRLGTRRAWPLTAVLYAAAHVPTMFLLSDPFAGPNPLIVIASLGCGLVWGLVVARTGRLPVAIISHALFTWCVAIQFPLWRLG